MGLQPTVALALCFLATHILRYGYGRTTPGEDPVAPIGESDAVRPCLVLMPVCLAPETGY